MSPPRRRRSDVDAPPGWSGRLVLLPGTLLYLGRGGAAAAHAHHAVQLVWARDGSVEVTTADGVVTTDAVLVPAQARHAFRATGSQLVMLLVERHAAAGLALDARARRGVDAGLAAELEAIGAPDPAAPLDVLARWTHHALDALTHADPARPRPSLAVRRVIAAIEAGQVADLDAAAAIARLSPTRLTHRFTAEVGLPFRRFVLWSRLERAVFAVRDGADLTRAAVEAGFADAAHFSRTFRETIGLAPSRVLPFLEIAGGDWTSAAT